MWPLPSDNDDETGWLDYRDARRKVSEGDPEYIDSCTCSSLEDAAEREEKHEAEGEPAAKVALPCIAYAMGFGSRSESIGLRRPAAKTASAWKNPGSALLSKHCATQRIILFAEQQICWGLEPGLATHHRTAARSGKTGFRRRASSCRWRHQAAFDLPTCGTRRALRHTPAISVHDILPHHARRNRVVVCQGSSDRQRSSSFCGLAAGFNTCSLHAGVAVESHVTSLGIGSRPESLTHCILRSNS